MINRINYLKDKLKNIESECRSQEELEAIKNTLEYKMLQVSLQMNLFVLEIVKLIKEIIGRR